MEAREKEVHEAERIRKHLIEQIKLEASEAEPADEASQPAAQAQELGKAKSAAEAIRDALQDREKMQDSETLKPLIEAFLKAVTN
eukprot:3279916-Alexandrium_andersonii.AAC.1